MAWFHATPEPQRLWQVNRGRDQSVKLVPEHRQTALRFRASRLILEDVPVFSQHPVGDPHDVGGDPVSRESGARESSVD
jgi:hypothetical protein